jgi:hypothetical protein
MNGNRPAAVASLVPLMVEAVDDVTSAPTRISRRGCAPLAAAQDSTKIDRRTPNRVDLGDLPTLVVPPPISMSSGSRRRPKEIADDVASQFDISPFESFEGDVQTIADVTDDDDDAPAHDALPPMGAVWIEADARIEPTFAIDMATGAGVDDGAAVDDASLQVDIEIASTPKRRMRWAAAFVAIAAVCAACAFVVDERVAAQTRAWSERALTIAQTEVVPELREIEARARGWRVGRASVPAALR